MPAQAAIAVFTSARKAPTLRALVQTRPPLDFVTRSFAAGAARQSALSGVERAQGGVSVLAAARRAAEPAARARRLGKARRRSGSRRRGDDAARWRRLRIHQSIVIWECIVCLEDPAGSALAAAKNGGSGRGLSLIHI